MKRDNTRDTVVAAMNHCVAMKIPCEEFITKKSTRGPISRASFNSWRPRLG